MDGNLISPIYKIEKIKKCKVKKYHFCENLFTFMNIRLEKTLIVIDEIQGGYLSFLEK